MIRQLAGINDRAGARRHLFDHDTFTGGHADPAGCDYCYVTEQGWLRDIHTAVFGPADRDLVALVWSMQDGYGAPGVTPSQGFDWSGIRDSSPATIEAMWHAVNAHQAA